MVIFNSYVKLPEGILVINQLSYIIAHRTLEPRLGNRRATAKAKPHVLGTFRFWNNLPTTLCAIGLSLRMTTKTSSENPSIAVFFLWNLPYLGGFQHRMWFLLYDVDTNIHHLESLHCILSDFSTFATELVGKGRALIYMMCGCKTFGATGARQLVVNKTCKNDCATCSFCLYYDLGQGPF
jgi:hypothetical protein